MSVIEILFLLDSELVEFDQASDLESNLIDEAGL